MKWLMILLMAGCSVTPVVQTTDLDDCSFVEGAVMCREGTLLYTHWRCPNHDVLAAVRLDGSENQVSWQCDGEDCGTASEARDAYCVQ